MVSVPVLLEGFSEDLDIGLLDSATWVGVGVWGKIGEVS
jgi:hypothetical protein